MAKQKILLVEGADDEHVLKHICGKRGITSLDEARTHGGVDALLESTQTRLKLSKGDEVVGVVIDADTDVNARWRSLRDRLVNVGYQNVPTAPASDGTIVDPPADTLLPRVGVWIMPDNRTNGILEDFLQFLVPQESPLYAHVRSSVATIPESERRFSTLAEPKAIIHTWLAWQEEPGKPLGTAITARFLDPNVAQVDVLVAWLKRLFFPSVPDAG
jgi:hypothetical protein